MSKIIYTFFFVFLCSGSLNGANFHVCTVASFTNGNLEKLQSSCNQHHIDLEIIGLGLPYYGNGTKLLRMSEYLETLDDDDIVMFVDAFDVLIIADKEVILSKFLDMNVPFVMSAEKNCFPFSHLASEYPETASPFKYINSGGFIGYVGTLKSWLTDLKPFDLQKGDQGQITIHYLLHRNDFVIDTSCELFLSLYQVKAEEIAIDEHQRVVRCLTTGGEPCAIHANGKSFYLWNIIYDQLVNK